MFIIIVIAVDVFPMGTRTMTHKLMSKVGQYHGTTSIDLILTSFVCQISNIIWTSSHEVSMSSRNVFRK